MRRKQGFFVLVFLLVLLGAQPSYSQDDFFTKQQEKTLFESVSVFGVVGNELTGITDDLMKIMEDIEGEEAKAIVLVSWYAIEMIAVGLGYEVEATLLFVPRPKKPKAVLGLRKFNLNRLRERMGLTLLVLQKSSGAINNKGALLLYDNAKRSLRTAMAALDENIEIIKSVDKKE